MTVNPKHFSNTEESIKIIEEIVLPYVEKEREKLDDPVQAALLILDVFKGQMTSEVANLLRNNIFFVTVPNNMTHLFQPLNLTVNGYCKSFMEKKFANLVPRAILKKITLVPHDFAGNLYLI